MIEITPEITEATINKKLEAYVGVSLVEGIIKQSVEVELHVNSFVISSDDIYLIKKNEDIPIWYEDLINNIIDDNDIVDDVTDLNQRFSNFETGVTIDITELNTADDSLNALITTVKSETDAQVAGIQQALITHTDTLHSQAVMDTLIAAYLNKPGGGAAWFNQKIASTASIANSAASNTSTLTAVMESQQDQLNTAFGDIAALEKQVDGVIETWFYTDPVVNDVGDILLTSPIYLSWYNSNPALDTRAIHTGDTYIQYEIVAGSRSYLGSWKFVKSSVNIPVTDSEGYQFITITDEKAEEAYQLALAAQDTADGKITTYLQSSQPSGHPTVYSVTSSTLIEEYDKLVGDIWFNVSDNNKQTRYTKTGTVPCDYTWNDVTDHRLEASVDRLDEATVDIDGNAYAKGSLRVNANGVVTGYTAEASSNPNYEGSSFNIYADNFTVSNYSGSYVGAPFSIDTVNNKIKFNGNVSFEGTPVDTAVQPVEVNGYVTNINGGAIQTHTVNANRLTAGSVWVDGYLRSSDWNYGDGSDDPVTGMKGFNLVSNNDWDFNIYGARIRGGYIYGSTIDAAVLNSVTINTGTLNADIINSGSITTSILRDFTNVEYYFYFTTIATISSDNSQGTSTFITGQVVLDNPSSESNLITDIQIIDSNLKVLFSQRIVSPESSYPTIIDVPRNTTYKLQAKLAYSYYPSATLSGNFTVLQIKK